MTLDADRASAEADLGPEGEAEWARLRRQIELADGFWLAFIFSSSPAAVATMRRRTDHVLALRAGKLKAFLPHEPDELQGVLGQLFEHSTADAVCVWVEAIVEDEGPWRDAWDEVFLRLNERRDTLRRHLSGGVVLAAPSRAKARARDRAPDLWSIRALVIELRGRPRASLRVSRDHESPATAPARQAPLPPSSSANARSALDRVAVALARGETDEAVEAGREAVELGRPSADSADLVAALTALSRAEEAHGDEAAAIDHAREALHLAGGGDDALRAELLDRIGRLALGRNDLLAAHETIGRLVDLRRRLAEVAPSQEAWRALSLALDQLGLVRRLSGDRAGETSAIEEELALDRQIIERYGESPAGLRDLAVSLSRLGDARLDGGDTAGAANPYEESLRLARLLLDRSGESPDRMRDLSVSLEKVGDMRRASGDAAGAAEAYEESLGLRRRLVKRSDESPDRLRDLTLSLNRVGDIRRDGGDTAGAAVAYEESLALTRWLVERYGESPQLLRDLGVILNRVGEGRRDGGDAAGAAAAYDESLGLTRRLVERYGENPERLRDLSVSLDRAGDARLEGGDVTGAAEAY